MGIIRTLNERLRVIYRGAMGQYNAAKPTLNDGESCALELDINGNLLVAPGAGGWWVVGGQGLQGATIDNLNWAPVEISLESEQWDGAAFSTNVPVAGDGDVVRPKGSRFGVTYATLTDETGAGRVTFKNDSTQNALDWGLGISAIRRSAVPTPVANAANNYGVLISSETGALWVQQDSRFARVGGYEQPGITIPAITSYDVDPTVAEHNYSTARGDGAAVRASDTTITLSGVASITTMQIRKVIIDDGTSVRILEQGHNGVRIVVSGTGPYTLTVNGAGATPVPNSTVGVEVLWAAQDKAFDSPTNANRGFEIAPLWSRNVQTPITIATAQAIGSVGAGVWNDVGPEIATQGYTRFTTWLDVTRTDAVGIRFRVLAKHTNGGTQEYLMPVFKPNTGAAPYTVSVDGETIVFAQDISQQIQISWDVSNTIPWIQLQWGATSGNTTTNILADCKVTYGFGS